ncbi:MAG: hypothetical protein HKP27_16480 [Myxococcales bacterium]|nr:hypothetical protein [Myxococcales bacterium]
MSVRGEFRRSAGLLQAFVAERDPHRALVGELASIQERAIEDLSGAAEEVEKLEAAGAFAFPVASEVADERAERVDHLIAIARIVLGH